MSIIKRIKNIFKKEEKTYIGTVIIRKKEYNFYNYNVDEDTQTISLAIDDYVDWDIGDTAITHFKDKLLHNLTVERYSTIKLFLNTKLRIKNSCFTIPASPSGLSFTKLELSLINNQPCA